jgi:hypothetical protein
MVTVAEAIAAVDRTRPKRGQSHCRRSRADVAGAECNEGRSVFREGGCACAASEVLGTARRNEYGAALA